MSYSDFDEVLRFGDVLNGYLSTTPRITKPITDNSFDDYQIEVEMPDFCVIMNPCCEIGNGSISLTPLIKITNYWLDNPFIAENLLILNKEIKPFNAIHPRQWNGFTDDEKIEYIEAYPRYQYTNFYIYDTNDKLPSYPITKQYKYELIEDDITGLPKYNVIKKEETIVINYYMIDFRNIYPIKCDKIIKDKIEEEIMSSKILQLSIYSRTDLRNKLAFHFINSPDQELG